VKRRTVDGARAVDDRLAGSAGHRGQPGLGGSEDCGGHFAALEAPDFLVADVRAFFRALRPRPPDFTPKGSISGDALSRSRWAGGHGDSSRFNARFAGCLPTSMLTNPFVEVETQGHEYQPEEHKGR